MISGAITAFLAFLQAVPAITGGINNFVNKYYDSKVQLVQARIGGDVEMAKTLVYGTVEQNRTRVAGLQVIASSRWLMFLFVGFALPFMIFEWQAIVYDKIIMHGTTSTDPITGELANWGQAVIYSLFGVAGAGTTVAGISQIVDKWRNTAK
jgi:hypothetical protein